MRLHHLQIQAFGPFGGTETIDFDALGAHGLFLMHGPTGSGKTTVLDAICFAVFAAVPGARRGQTERLTSDHAQPGRSPQVRLEFTVAQRRLRITRSPKHFVAKKRGSGETPRQAKVLLEERRGGVWAALSTRADETAHLLDELLGLGLEQFAQVVLLPQGEFAAFLRAKADDRAALLQKLFDISRFADLEEWLAERRRSVRAQLAEFDRELALAVVRAEESLVELAPEIEHWRTSPVVTLPEQIAETRTRTSAHLSEAMAMVERTSRAAEHAARAHEQATALLGLQQQGAKAAATWQQWEEQADARAEAEARLAAHQRAAQVNPWLRAHQRAATRHHDTEQAVAGARAQLEAAGVTAPERIGDRLSAAEQALSEAAAAERLLARAERESPRASTAVASARAALAALEVRREELNERVGALSTTIAAARTTIDAVGDLDRREALLKEWGHASTQLADALRVQETTAAARTATAQRYAAAEAEVLELRTRRLAGFAGELALELAPGSPCAVCGSLEHPAPASTSAAVSAELVAEAESRAAAARSEHERAQVRHTTADATVQHLSDRRRQLSDDWQTATGTPLDEATVRDLRDRVDAERTTHDDARRMLAAAEQETAQLAPRLRTLETEQRTAEQAMARAAAEEHSLQTQVDEATARRTQALDEHTAHCPCTDAQTTSHEPVHEPVLEPVLEQVLNRHKLVRLLIDTWQQAAEHAELAAAALSEATHELNRQLEAEGFSDGEQLASALLPTAAESELRHGLRAAHEAAQRARGVLDQPEIAAALDAEPADPGPALQQRRDAHAQDRRAQDAFTAAQRAMTSLDRLADEVERLLEQSGSQRASLPSLDRMADLVSGAGDNALRMRLSAYVLAARLEEVTVLANHQLEIMSAGRYLLEHTDAKAKGGARSGLGLVVRDSWTGTARDTATLSGGETFMVSLALALALGQAVLHDSGGRPLETLLVDEGFGSLDDESLELVMQVLDELRSGGRTVGIVSHVGELRSRVPAQIRVHKTEQGSRVEVHVGDAPSAA